MNDEQKTEISTLAEEYGNARRVFECLQAMNVYGKTSEELADLNVRYHLADAEMWAAYSNLQKAKAKICT